MRTLRRVGLRGLTATAALLGTVVAGGLAPAPALAASVVQYGTVTFVPDGDTIDVRIGDRVQRVRFAGTQAMELHTYRSDLAEADGECHALAATARLRTLLGGRRVVGSSMRTDGVRVRLTARRASSSSRDRDQRFVAVRINGSWRDVGALMVQEGHVLPQFHPVEYTRNLQYRRLAMRAAAGHRGIWNRDACAGPRPEPDARLSVRVRWDARGDDAGNVNGEYVVVRNVGRTTVSLGRWWLRDSALRRYTIPAGTRLERGQVLVLHAGRGRAARKGGALHLYWGQSHPVFENVSRAPAYMGDGGYLFDHSGNLRAWRLYGAH